MITFAPICMCIHAYDPFGRFCQHANSFCSYLEVFTFLLKAFLPTLLSRMLLALRCSCMHFMFKIHLHTVSWHHGQNILFLKFFLNFFFTVSDNNKSSWTYLDDILHPSDFDFLEWGCKWDFLLLTLPYCLADVLLRNCIFLTTF